MEQDGQSQRVTEAAKGAPPSPRPLAVLAALENELSPLVKLLAGRRRVQADGGAYLAGAIAGRPVVMLAGGMGSRAAKRACDWIARAASPRAVLAVGFAGALRAGLRSGDLVLAEEVYEPPSPEGEGPRQWSSEPGLLEIARSAAGPAQVGRFVTARSVLSAAAKRDFGERHRGIAVDMESAGIARAANVRDLPVLYARAIVDELDFEWPLDFTPLLTPEGRLKPLRLLGALARRPAALLRLPDLERRARLAGEALARFVGAFAAALPAEETSRRGPG